MRKSNPRYGVLFDYKSSVGYILVVVQLVISVLALGGVLSACGASLWWLIWGGCFVYGGIFGDLVLGIWVGRRGMTRRKGEEGK